MPDLFRQYKCGQLISKRRKINKTEGDELPRGNIVDVQDTNKYLKILQANGNHKEATKKTATAKKIHTLRTVNQVLIRQLNGKNKITTIINYAPPETRHPAGIIMSPQEEIEATDINKRKLLNMH